VRFWAGPRRLGQLQRRLRMKNGQTWSHPGKGNPGIVGYAGPIDPDVGVLGVWSGDGRFLGCLANFACHATTNPGGSSANWIYYMEQTIRGAFGDRTPVVFLQGACGDITQVDNLSKHENPAPEEWARLVGGRVGAEAVKVLLGMSAVSDVRVNAHSTTIQVQRRHPRPQRLAAAVALVENSKEPHSTEYTFAKEIVLLDSLLRKKPVATVEIQAIQVGPAVFISNPASSLWSWASTLSARATSHSRSLSSLPTDAWAMFPTEEAFGPHGGGYETRLTSYSTSNRQQASNGRGRTRPGSQNDAWPDPGPAEPPPFSQPWSYGNVPPELD